MITWIHMIENNSLKKNFLSRSKGGMMKEKKLKQS